MFSVITDYKAGAGYILSKVLCDNILPLLHSVGKEGCGHKGTGTMTGDEFYQFFVGKHKFNNATPSQYMTDLKKTLEEAGIDRKYALKLKEFHQVCYICDFSILGPF